MRRLLAALVPAAVPAAVLAASPLLPAHAETVEVSYHDLGGPGVAEPRLIHTAFNASPYYKKLAWEGWGTEEATATGILDNSCASCGGQAKIPAVLTFTGFETCEDGTTIYHRTRALLTFKDGTTKQKRVVNPCATPE